MQVHFYLGYSVLTLVLFRLLWGAVGGHWSRFARFVPSLSRVVAYVRQLRAGESAQSVGHNPLGALSVLAMLSFLLLQVLTGLLSDDEIAAAGPWTPLVSGETIAQATWYHTTVGKGILITLVSVHIAAVVFYRRFKNEDLITPMIHGDKSLPPQTPASRDNAKTRVLALLLCLACGWVVRWLVQLGSAMPLAG